MAVPGWTCVDGYCEETERKSIEKFDKVKDYLAEKSKDQAIDYATGKALEEVLDHMGSWGKRFLGGMNYLARFNILTTAASAYFGWYAKRTGRKL